MSEANGVEGAPLVNLVAELDERFDERARAAAVTEIERAGYTFEQRESADDRTLAWIDATFAGWWSSEAFAGVNAIARRHNAPAGFATFDPRGLRFAWLSGVAKQKAVGIFGPFGVDPSSRGGPLGAALLTIALAGLRQRGYAKALIPAVGEEGLIRYYAAHADARVVERFDQQHWRKQRVRTVVMASGGGTNFQAVADAAKNDRLPLDIVALVSNVSRAGAVSRARSLGIRDLVLPWMKNGAGEPRASYDERLRKAVFNQRPELILLLGWMHLLDEPFVNAFPETLNLHPAFLPLDPAREEVGMPDGTTIAAFRGARAVRDAIDAGSAWIGASVHRVTSQTDRGPILARMPLSLESHEQEAHALERLHGLEHRLVERAVMRWIYERADAR